MAGAMAVMIRNVRVFDGEALLDGAKSVLVRDGRIAAVMAAGEETPLDEPTTVIDGAGGVLMPGLVEAHAHLTWGSSVEKIYHQFILPEDELKVAAWHNARVLLDHGFTSAYSAGALGDGIEVALARAIDAGETPGPRLVPSTLERGPEGAEGVDTGDVFNGRGAEAIRKFVAYCKEEGFGSLKVVVSGEVAL